MPSAPNVSIANAIVAVDRRLVALAPELAGRIVKPLARMPMNICSLVTAYLRGEPMFSTILCATDGSDHADKAVAVAADLGRRYNARVIILTAYDPIPRELGEPNLEHLMGRRLKAAEGLANAATAVMTGQGITPVVEMLEGPAARAILEVARTRRCDLIVMGARGLSPFGAMLLGSVSMRVVHEAPCPVLLTR